MRGFAFAVAAAGLALCCAPAAAQADDTVWLCKPGVSPNPCLGSLETTYIEPDGRSRVENPPNARDPKVDCFYVYPTVSDQKSTNSDRTIEPEQVAIAGYQAARFSEKCRVFAPMYRQRTIAALTAPASTQEMALAIAYADIKAAWREYLVRDNRGRGVVLIGHSQGTRMLRQLIKEEIDPQPLVRRKLVSAVLLGGNVLVREVRARAATSRTCRRAPPATRSGA